MSRMEGKHSVEEIPVDRIRPEDGLGRLRDREGHRELCRSIEKFGVLTPITVRRAPDNREEYLLIKGQGRTLACRLIGLISIPAVIVSDEFAETEKVGQFLVENVARLRMRPIDRALLIARARQQGEETAAIAKRFGVSYSTVRRLEAQLEGASHGEVSAIRATDLNLARHAVIARHVDASERASVIHIVAEAPIRTGELEALFVALGWRNLTDLGPDHDEDRFRLLEWAITSLAHLPKGNPRERIRQLATQLPMKLATIETQSAVGR
jgi:ParB/RepB/Spo0J family partition protein